MGDVNQFLLKFRFQHLINPKVFWIWTRRLALFKMCFPSFTSYSWWYFSDFIVTNSVSQNSQSKWSQVQASHDPRGISGPTHWLGPESFKLGISGHKRSWVPVCLTFELILWRGGYVTTVWKTVKYCFCYCLLLASRLGWSQSALPELTNKISIGLFSVIFMW